MPQEKLCTKLLHALFGPKQYHFGVRYFVSKASITKMWSYLQFQNLKLKLKEDLLKLWHTHIQLFCFGLRSEQTNLRVLETTE